MREHHGHFRLSFLTLFLGSEAWRTFFFHHFLQTGRSSQSPRYPHHPRLTDPLKLLSLLALYLPSFDSHRGWKSFIQTLGYQCFLSTRPVVSSLPPSTLMFPPLTHPQLTMATRSLQKKLESIIIKNIIIIIIISIIIIIIIISIIISIIIIISMTIMMTSEDSMRCGRSCKDAQIVAPLS
ncbi:hypothetical protein FHG87_003014 [Trinorchestia longiramus]|nr:hypothetical protein FHG87_003014 [Trinorchestia longiramus]